jgi:hypothetical protein
MALRYYYYYYYYYYYFMLLTVIFNPFFFYDAHFQTHAVSYPYSLTSHELRLKQHEEVNVSEKLRATRAKLREATKALAAAHQNLARDNLMEKHKLTVRCLSFFIYLF